MPDSTAYKTASKTKTNTVLPAELEARIQYLESLSQQDTGFSKTDWLSLWVLGAIVPALLLIWGWF